MTKHFNIFIRDFLGENALIGQRYVATKYDAPTLGRQKGSQGMCELTLVFL